MRVFEHCPQVWRSERLPSGDSKIEHPLGDKLINQRAAFGKGELIF